MKTQLSHKPGANRKETVRKSRRHDANFSQSRDIREDRGTRQQKFVRQPQTPLTYPARLDHPRDRGLLLPEHTASAKRPVVIKVNHPSARTVTVTGTFNEWHPESIPLRRIQNDEWVAELSLEVGVYEYRFLVDGRWEDDPKAQQLVLNGFGSMNAVLKVTN